MNYATFERVAHEIFSEIPDEYRAGIVALRVLPEEHGHPSLPDVYTMGECVTEAYPSGFDGPETVHSLVVLYHGSFRRLAEQEPDFDWEEQIWETIVHEIQHHLESLAGQDDLEEIDYAVDEDFKRGQGEAFDPFYYQRGHDLGDGAFEVEGRYFLEMEWAEDERPEQVEFDWDDRAFAVPFPAGPGDVHFLQVWQLPEDAALDLVLIRKRRMRTRIRSALKREKLSVTETRADAVPVPAR